MHRNGNNLKHFSYRAIILTLSLIIIMGSAVGGTVAWMYVKADPVENTFAYSDINIRLTETDTKDDEDKKTNTYHFTPKDVISNDPLVTVEAGSERCWLFVEVEKGGAFDSYMSFEIADGWSALEGSSGIFYRPVECSDVDQGFSVLKENTVRVVDGVTQEELDNLPEANFPTLNIRAFAVQQESVSTAGEAWNIIEGEVTHLQDRTEPLKNSFVPIKFKDHDLDIKVTGDHELLGRDWQEGDSFLFMLQMWDETSGTWVTKGTQSVVYNENTEFKNFDFSHQLIHQLTEPKYYFFRIAEGQGNLPGIHYDKGVREFFVSVTADENGIMSISEVLDMENTAVTWNSETGSYEVAVKFVNTYVAPHEPPVIPDPDPVSVEFEINKSVENTGSRKLSPDGFEFCLEKNSTGEVWATTSDASGRAEFQMTYSKEDIDKVFIYKLHEKTGTHAGVTYDQREYTITVGVSLDEANNRLITAMTLDGVSVDSVKVDFRNVYNSAEDGEEPTEPSEPEKPSEPSQPIEPEDPTEPEKPIGPSLPTEPEKPSEPTEPSVPDKPDEPSQPTEPEAPSEPSQPTEPEKPTEPGEPSKPTDPVDPENPFYPWYPTGPEEPSLPDNPTDQADPSLPSEPGEPSLPDGPADSDQPDDEESDADGQYEDKDYGAQTGDGFTLYVYMILLLASAAIMILIIKRGDKV